MRRFLFLALAVAAVVMGPADLNAQRSKKAVAAEEQRMPVVGVSAKASGGGGATNMTYINAVRRAGGVPLIIPMTSDSMQIAAVLNVVDAVIAVGGEDFDPQLFGEQPVRALGEVAPERDLYDLMLIRMSVRSGKPFIGICRGEQGLNVAMGGTLYQDIPSQKRDSFVKHNQNAPGTYGTHRITIDPESILCKMLGGKTSINVNSFHHQAVKDIAPGFKVVATSDDGVVEAIEMIGNNKVLGVQFHPEIFAAAGNDEFLGIFRYLINLAKENKSCLKR